MAQGDAGDLDGSGRFAAHLPADLRVVVARHPEPVAARLQQAQRGAVLGADAGFRQGVVKAVAERDHTQRRKAQDRGGERRQRRRRIIGRQEDAARGVGRALFEMQVGDDQGALLREPERAPTGQARARAGRA